MDPTCPKPDFFRIPSARGFTLIEMLIYIGLLSIILVALYQVFALGGTQKVGEVVNDELYRTSERIHAELLTTVKNASTIDQPALGTSGSILSLDGGSIVYDLDSAGYLQKTAGGDTARIMPDGILVDSITFTHVGPSADSPTVIVEYTLESARTVQGSSRQETFRTGVTVR